VLGAVRAAYLRRRGDWLAGHGRAREAQAAYARAAEGWEAVDPVLAAGCWEAAARAAAAVEDRPAQVAAAQRALTLLPPESGWVTPLMRAAGSGAAVTAADGLYWLDRLAEAEAMARRAVAVAEAGGDPIVTLAGYATLGQVLFRLGRPVETLGCQTRVLELARATADPRLVAAALTDRGVALWGLEQFDQALAATTEALAAIEKIDDPAAADRERISTLAALASVRRSSGDLPGAVAAAEQAMALAERYQRREQYLQAKTAWSLAKLASGELAAATTGLRKVYEETSARGTGHLAGRAAGSLATGYARSGALAQARRWAEQAVAAQGTGDIEARAAARYNLACLTMAGGDLAPAQATLESAIEDWEAVRQQLTEDRLYVDVLEKQARAYRTLQACRLAGGDPAGAWVAAEQARGRSLLRQLRTQPTVPAGALPVEAVVALAAERETGFLVYSLLPPAWEPLAGAPGDATAGLHGWYLDATGLAHHWIDLAALRAKLGRADRTPEADPYLGLTRDFLVPAPATGPDPQADLAVASELLLQPLSEALAGSPARRLVLVPDGELDRVPFAALRLSSGEALADRWPTAVVPAIAVFAELAARPAPAPAAPELLLVGNPAPPRAPLAAGLPVPDLPPLAHAEREVQAIAEGYRSGVPLVGGAATRSAVLARIASATVVHFATHGLHGAAGGGTPGALCLSPDRGHDGYLRADEVAALRLPRCRLAVLSACRTGWGRSTYEGTLGLARAFLIAGVPAVVVSLWPVYDAAAADLMIAVHHHLRAGLPIGEALRRSMLAARADGAPIDDWAAFTVVGDPQVRLV